MAYKMIINSNKTPSIFDSKLGGLPYWDFDSDKEYPVDSEGKKMQLLAQINFENESFQEEFLKKGILQFFISEDSDIYGLDFENQASQKTFRVVYHENINKSVTEERIESENVPVNLGELSTPVSKECAISFEQSDETAESGIFVNANFTQEDPRENMDEDEAAKYNTVLLQLDSNDGSVDGEDYFMWGDMGIGAFFINNESLKKLDFSDVLYNWDCC